MDLEFLGGDGVSISVPDEVYDVLETIEDVLKNWDIYKLIIRDMDKYPGIQRYELPAYIMQCINERSEYLSRRECKYMELKYFKGRNYKQIAKSLGISLRSVANWRIRILLKIAKRGGLI